MFIGVDDHSSFTHYSQWQRLLDDATTESHIYFSKNLFPEHLLEQWTQLCCDRVAWASQISTVTNSRIPRKAAWFCNGGCTCTYRYGGTEWPPTAFPPWLSEITQVVAKACGVEELPNSCNLNLYSSPEDQVGWHADKEKLFQRKDAKIISLSLGATRHFQIRKTSTLGDFKDVALESGDILVMTGATQRFYSHRVPPVLEQQRPRIN